LLSNQTHFSLCILVFSLLFSSLLYSLCLFFLSWRFFPNHFCSEHGVSLQGSEGVLCAFFIPYPEGVCTVKAAAACNVQVIFRHVSSAAIAASKNPIFAEDKLSGQVHVLFQVILFTFPVIRFSEVQYFTQYNYVLYTFKTLLFCSIIL
jgi:hypothetical protein